ncbi:uncharacterized protein LOC108031280 isoform X1 [Drosophila biarmipes]|uniref:uncharacterized protein LOC108031280 isoform X1 n=1 Tax=Drosophila biarmipes TaxID=125945 RepID=UPI0021CCBF60|nr:uncharacterized protein LOC108031280 isoform X1 [Drosophila biarmipes]
MKSITLFLTLSVLLSAKLSLTEAASPRDYYQILQPVVAHFKEFKQKADQNHNLNWKIADLQENIKLLKSELAAADAQITVKRDIISVQDEKIRNLLQSKTVNLLHENIKNLQDALKMAQGEIVSQSVLLNNQFEKSTAEKELLKNQIAGLSEQLQNLNREWEVAKGVIKTNQEAITSKNEQIQSLSALLKIKDSRIDELKAQILLKDDEISSQKARLERIQDFLAGVNLE